jgi:hypothetical protein
MKITNTQSGPRGVNAVNGPVLIEPGQTWEGEVYARERQHLEASGWFEIKGDYALDPGATPPEATDKRDENGDTAEMAEMRSRFDHAYRIQGDKLTAADGELADRGTKLEAANRRIAELETDAKKKDGEISDLKKQLPETDIDKMTVAELRAHLAYRDIAFDSKKDKKEDLVTLARASAA